MAATGSNFSDHALTTLESLVLECQLETAKELMAASSSNGYSSSPSTPSSVTNNSHVHPEMPYSDWKFIKKIKGNKLCADCLAKEIEWASVTYGILLCTECSGVHRALGTHLSRVRSIKMDSWSDAHIYAMRHGGNQRCREYLTKHGLDLNVLSIRERYESKAAKTLASKIAKAVQKAENEAKEAAKENKNHATTEEEAAKTTPSSPTKTTTPTKFVSPIKTPPNKRFQRHYNRAHATKERPKRSLSASAPTIVYMGRSFPANDPFGEDANTETLKLNISNDDDDKDALTPTKKLEALWKDGEAAMMSMSSNQSLTSHTNSLSSGGSISWFSFGSAGSSNSRNHAAALSSKDLETLQHDPIAHEYVRQQLLKRWNQQQQQEQQQKRSKDKNTKTKKSKDKDSKKEKKKEKSKKKKTQNKIKEESCSDRMSIHSNDTRKTKNNRKTTTPHDKKVEKERKDEETETKDKHEMVTKPEETASTKESEGGPTNHHDEKDKKEKKDAPETVIKPEETASNETVLYQPKESEPQLRNGPIDAPASIEFLSDE